MARPKKTVDTTMSIKPLFDNVVIKPLDAETRTASGIVLPDTVKEKPQMGEVVAVGPGARDEDGERISMEVKVGQRVLFKKWAGTETKLEGEEYMIVEQKDILAVVE